MELGCGLRTMTVKGHAYLYVWHYETRDGRRKQLYDYIGPVASLRAQRRAAEVLEGYTRRAIREAQRRVRRDLAAVG